MAAGMVQSDRGAPTKYSEETVETVLDFLRRGSGKTIAARAASITYRTLANWQHKYPEFSRKVEEAVQEGRQHVKDQALAVIRSNWQNDWKAAAWTLERMFPEEFSRVTKTVDLTVQQEEDEEIPAFRLSEDVVITFPKTKSK